MGETIPSWDMVVEVELERLKKFGDFLRCEDREIFNDLLSQCRSYASFAGTVASPVSEIPLLMAMLFGQHQRLMELERRINQQPTSGAEGKPSSRHFAEPLFPR
jgi:hypothetical protein